MEEAKKHKKKLRRKRKYNCRAVTNATLVSSPFQSPETTIEEGSERL